MEALALPAPNLSAVAQLAPMLLLLLALPLDSLVHPRPGQPWRPWRRPAGVWLLLAMNVAGFGFFLAASGNGWLSAVLVLAVQVLFVAASNAKRKMLGEPLLFSDLALVGAVFRHPQFYLSAIRVWQRVVAGLAECGVNPGAARCDR